MKRYVILLIGLAFSTLVACTGDCLSCHPALVPTIQDDPRHKPMLTCIECHSGQTDAMAECGSDCFACHPVEKIQASQVPAHDVVFECRECHMGIDTKEQLDPTKKSMSQQPMKELLLQ